MTSWHCLLACAQADVTIGRIASLAATAHGGLVLVGITDTDRKIIGVKTEALAHVADMLDQSAAHARPESHLTWPPPGRLNADAFAW